MRDTGITSKTDTISILPNSPPPPSSPLQKKTSFHMVTMKASNPLKNFAISTYSITTAAFPALDTQSATLKFKTLTYHYITFNIYTYIFFCY